MRRRCLADMVEDAEEGLDSEFSELFSPGLLTSKRCCSTADRMVLSRSLNERNIEPIKKSNVFMIIFKPCFKFWKY